MKQLRNRIQSPTPKWFKHIIRLSLTLAAAGGALLTASATVEGFVLPAGIEKAAQWMVVAGLVAAAVSKTAKDDNLKILVLALFTTAMFANSCRAPKPLTVTTTEKITDSTSTEVTYTTQPTPINIPADSADVTISLVADELDPSSSAVKNVSFDTTFKSESGRVIGSASLKAGQLNIKCKADSLQKIVDLLNKTLREFRLRVVEKEVVKTVPVPVVKREAYIPKWLWWILAISLGFNAWYNRKNIGKLIKLVKPV